jgi:ABC-type uncharacterized transport system ATPase subunit
MGDVGHIGLQTMVAPLLKIDSIDVSRNDIKVLKDVSLEIRQGEIVGVIGISTTVTRFDQI